MSNRRKPSMDKAPSWRPRGMFRFPNLRNEGKDRTLAGKKRVKARKAEQRAERS